MLAKHFKLLLTSPHAFPILKLQHLRMSQVITLIMLTLVAMVTTSVDEVSASSKYEEMGPFPVHAFQTSHPDLTYFSLCKSFTIINGPSAHNNNEGYHKPPVHLFVVAPSMGGHFPVLLFKHGTFLANCAYSQLLLHIASYGYIVVAPQASMNLLSFDATDEIKQTIEVQDWLPGNLSMLLSGATPEEAGEVVPDLEKLMISGHSRGGKVAYALALGLLSESQDPHKYIGLFALDPVDGVTGPMDPPIVTRDDVNLAFPVFILGTEYGSEDLLFPFVACAPSCCNHNAYANVTHAPVTFHYIALEYGHMDILDDSMFLSPLMCKSGKEKEPLRKVSAALLLAFFESIITRSPTPLAHAISDASIGLMHPASTYSRLMNSNICLG